MRDILRYMVYIVLIIIIGVLSYNNYKLNQTTKSNIEEITKIDKDTKISTTIYYDQTIESLKKENKELYDSIKKFKDEIDYLASFKYKKTYVVDTVYIDTTKTTDRNDAIKTYEYANSENDTLSYKLSIGSVTEPNWYALNFKVSDRFTLINKKNDNGINSLDIIPQNKGDISDVDVFRKQSKKRSFLDRVCLGPSINLGYDFVDKDLDVSIGVALTIDLLNK